MPKFNDVVIFMSELPNQHINTIFDEAVKKLKLEGTPTSTVCEFINQFNTAHPTRKMDVIRYWVSIDFSKNQ